MKNLPPTSTDAYSAHKPTHEAQYVYAHVKHEHNIALTQTLSLKACMIVIIVFALVHLKKNQTCEDYITGSFIWKEKCK